MIGLLFVRHDLLRPVKAFTNKRNCEPTRVAAVSNCTVPKSPCTNIPTLLIRQYSYVLFVIFRVLRQNALFAPCSTGRCRRLITVDVRGFTQLILADTGIVL